MKIIKLHIENFGKLHNFDLTLKDGINQIKNNNGWGKTTLSIFIKSMFYGLPAKSRGDEIKYERTRFAPWQGGNFGGYIEFEDNGILYRVTRLFGKVPEDDSYELLNLNTSKIEKIEKIPLGEQIFGVGVDSFVMTAFFPQLNYKSEINDNITASLTGANKYQDDLAKIENALKSLKDKKNYIKRNSVKKEQLEYYKSELLNNNANLLQTENKIKDIERKREEELRKIVNLNDTYENEKKKLEKNNENYLQKELINQKLIESSKKLKDLNDKYLCVTQNINDSKTNQKLKILGIGIVVCILFLIMVIIFSVFDKINWIIGGTSIGIVLAFLIFFCCYFFKLLNLKTKNFKNINIKNLLVEINKAKKEHESLEKIKDESDEFISPEHIDINSSLIELKNSEIVLSGFNKELEILMQKKEDIFEKIDYFQQVLNNSTQDRENDFSRIELIEKTINFLEIARNNVSQRYISELNENFKNIFDKFKIEDKNFIVTNNFQIYKQSPQGLKSFEYESQGIKDIISFCQRLSLTEKIFKESKPFIVLDDTFVNLDDNMFDCAKEIVNYICKSYQVIYICCNERCKIL